VTARACQLEVDAEIQRHAVGHDLGEPRRQLEVEVGIQHQPLLYRAQLRLAHLDLVGARQAGA
jgi:hypothetical protein